MTLVHPEQPAATVYRCARCRREFMAMTIAATRQATGRSVGCCGTPAWWVRNLTAAEAADWRPAPVLPRQSPRPTYRRQPGGYRGWRR